MMGLFAGRDLHSANVILVGIRPWLRSQVYGYSSQSAVLHHAILHRRLFADYMRRSFPLVSRPQDGSRTADAYRRITC
jgi:hypothetical protein